MVKLLVLLALATADDCTIAPKDPFTNNYEYFENLLAPGVWIPTYKLCLMNSTARFSFSLEGLGTLLDTSFTLKIANLTV